MLSAFDVEIFSLLDLEVSPSLCRGAANRGGLEAIGLAQNEQAAEYSANFGAEFRRVAHDLAALRGGQWPERYLVNQGTCGHGRRL